MFRLDVKDITSLESYLRGQGWLSDKERVSMASIPGEGNMNYVLRITTEDRSFIVKQSREYVEKYPQVPAPAERVLLEGAFYQKTELEPSIAKFTPKLIGIDPENNIIALEDLGMASDFMFLYQSSRALTRSQLFQLTNFLGSLHKRFYRKSGQESFQNKGMRTLNHEHLFQYPFREENGFDLDTVQPGLQTVAAGYKNDNELKKEVCKLGEIYLSTGNCLLHGDFYPGSWLQTTQGIKIIDPEFCFFGPPEFDLGVMIAHLHLAGERKAITDLTREQYNSGHQIDHGILNQFIGIEICRRLIGLAQLPLHNTLEEKQALLGFARTLIMP